MSVGGTYGRETDNDALKLSPRFRDITRQSLGTLTGFVGVPCLLLKPLPEGKCGQ
jgi:hypothetical protein